ncbi:ABC transporter substrate-binding protein [Microbacterium suaedae]|uniref:ABC transporter substrate-binding protein n=1 Tax=Microbacterium suaedae TaxID=2067813 RepID=UPI000DA1BD17|nr:extracellular solute-binding protein [Microbacterium suaedae]
MKRSTQIGVAATAGAALFLAGCSGSADGGSGGDPDTLTISGWSVSTTPEFQLLADGFEAANDGVTVEIVDYDPTEYNTLVTADLAAGSAPDIITQKEVKYVTTFQDGGQLVDVSDVELPDGIGGVEAYEIDGSSYATPYRQDAWVLFYNKDLFETAGVEQPDGSWTWDDYVVAAEELAESTDAKGAYQHNWQSVVQGFANAQSGADILAGDYDHLAPFYERSLALQDAGAQETFNTVSANQLTYQGEFGNQRAAMMPMGTWYVATLISQQEAGEADDFEWGIAPIPQIDESTTGTENTPVTFGDPTGFGINTGISEEKQELAKEFLAYAASSEAAAALAEIGITPAYLDDAVVEAYFSADGAPSDELSTFAVQTHQTLPENPTSDRTSAIQNILSDLHSAILSGSSSVEDAIAEAEERVANEVGEE